MIQKDPNVISSVWIEYASCYSRVVSRITFHILVMCESTYILQAESKGDSFLFNPVGGDTNMFSSFFYFASPTKHYRKYV